MKAAILLAAVLAANVHGAAIDARQIRPTSRPSNPGGIIGDGIAAHIHVRNAQGQRPPEFSIGNPTQSVTFWPNNPDEQLVKCGLDAFLGHTPEALLFCSSILKGGTLTTTTTYTARATTTITTTAVVTLQPPSSSARPVSTTRVIPPTSTPRPSTSAPVVRPSSSSSARPPTSSVIPPSSTTPRPSSTSASPTPSTTPAPANCGIVGYTKSTAAYYFESSGTKNTFDTCSALCKADNKCKSFGYGEANCMLFDVTAADNTNYNPMSPYTFYDAACPAELPVKKRQINISLGLGPGGPSSACACLIPTGVYASTTTVVASVTSARVTKTETVTRTVSLLPGSP